MSLGNLPKDPGAQLDYYVEWGDWLASGETISTVTWTVPAGITTVSTSNTTTAATIWLSGGTVGQRYAITCQVTTTDGRIDQRTFDVLMMER